jgi:hypothetical protein
MPAHWRVICFRLPARAIAALSTALVSVTNWNYFNMASFWSQFMSFFAGERELFKRDPALMDLAMKNAATKRHNSAQILGVDDNISETGVFLFQHVDQVESRTAVENAFRLDMQVSIVPFKFDLKMSAHVCFSPSLM